MKTALNKRVFALAFLCVAGTTFQLISSVNRGTAATTPSSQTSPDEQNANYTCEEDLMRDFLDTSKRPNAKPAFWLEQFKRVFQKDPKMKNFYTELVQAARFKNPNRIVTLFLMHKQKFSERLQKELLARGIEPVKKALEERLKK